MKLTIIDNLKIEFYYYGEDKMECITNLIEVKNKFTINNKFTKTIESVAELLKENVSQMVDDEDVAISALEAVSKGFGYEVIWSD